MNGHCEGELSFQITQYPFTHVQEKQGEFTGIKSINTGQGTWGEQELHTQTRDVNFRTETKRYAT